MHFCKVEFMNLLFRIGVTIAIFGFIWGCINFGLSLLRAGRKKTAFEHYAVKIMQYYFLVDVVFLICIHQDDSLSVSYKIVNSSLILLIYFVGKLQKHQMKQSLFNIQIQGAPAFKNPFASPFNLPSEIAAIVLGIVAFAFFYFEPKYAYNPIGNWFYDSIKSIETTPIFGFVFKVIGFFVLINICFKLLKGLVFILSGGKLSTRTAPDSNDSQDDETHFDDFEEVNE